MTAAKKDMAPWEWQDRDWQAEKAKAAANRQALVLAERFLRTTKYTCFDKNQHCHAMTELANRLQNRHFVGRWPGWFSYFHKKMDVTMDISPLEHSLHGQPFRCWINGKRVVLTLTWQQYCALKRMRGMIKSIDEIIAKQELA